MILDTRPLEYHTRNPAYAGLGIPILHWGTVYPEPIPEGWLDPKDFDAVLITSPVAVTLMPPGWTKHTGIASAAGSAGALRDAGFTKVIDAGTHRPDIAKAVQSVDFKRAFYPSSSTVFVEFSPEMAAKIVRRDIYKVVHVKGVPDDVAAKIRANRVFAPLLSAGGAKTLAKLLTAANLGDTVTAVGQSAEVLAGLPGPWRNSVIASEPNIGGVAAAIRRLAAAA